MSSNTELPSLERLSADLQDFVTQNTQYPAILAVGAIVVRPPKTPGDDPTALILQRHIGDSFGGKWDIPGGGVDIEPDTKSKGPSAICDSSIVAACTREVLEETGLHVSTNHGCVYYHEWGTRFTKWIRRLWNRGFLLRSVLAPGRTDWWTSRVLREGYVGKFTFLVDVEEFSKSNAASRSPAATAAAAAAAAAAASGDEEVEVKVILSETEHQAYKWITQKAASERAERWGIDEEDSDFISKEDLESVVVGIQRWREIHLS